MKLMQNTEKAGVFLGFMTVFPSETLQISHPHSTHTSPGNEKPVKLSVTAETLSMVRSLGAIRTKPIMKYSCTKANLHIRPWNSRAVNEKAGGARKKGKEKPSKRDFGNPGSADGNWKEVLVSWLVSMWLGMFVSKYEVEPTCSRHNFTCLMLLAGNKPNSMRLYDLKRWSQLPHILP